jgi:hypothetical protein
MPARQADAIGSTVSRRSVVSLRLVGGLGDPTRYVEGLRVRVASVV